MFVYGYSATGARAPQIMSSFGYCGSGYLCRHGGVVRVSERKAASCNAILRGGGGRGTGNQRSPFFAPFFNMIERPVPETYRHYNAGLTCTYGSEVRCARGLSIETSASHPALRSRQLGPIKAELLADPAQVAWIEVLVRTAKRRLRCPSFSMHRYHNRTLATLMMFTIVEATPTLRQPIPKCRAFHYCSPVK